MIWFRSESRISLDDDQQAMTPSQSQQPPGGGRRATRQGFLGGAVDLGGQGQDDQDGMNPSQRIQLPGAGRQGFLGDDQEDTRGGLLGGAVGLGGAETRATKRPGEDLVVRLDLWDETRATKWTLFILGGDFLVGAMAWTTKRPEKKMVVRLDSGAETRATISCWEVAGMPPSEDPLVTTKRTCLMGGHGFDDLEDGLPSQDRQHVSWETAAGRWQRCHPACTPGWCGWPRGTGPKR